MGKELKENSRLAFDVPVKVSFKNAVKNLLYPILALWYRIVILLFSSKDLRSCKYGFSVCAIFKNEASFLREWLEYHLMLGVDHFYLYNNNSTDSFAEVLAPYIAKGQVDLFDWPEVPGQLSAYKNWYVNFREETRWVTFIDIDEFIVPGKAASVKEWIEGYSRYPVVIMYWRFFCSSGRVNPDADKPVIEQYFTCQSKPLNIGKVVCNTRFDIDPFKMAMWHSTRARVHRISVPPVNAHRKFVIWDIHLLKKSSLDLLLNHYWSKSYSDIMVKKGKGASAFTESYITDEWFWRNDRSCVKADFTIYRFLLPLKLRLLNNMKQE